MGQPTFVDFIDIDRKAGQLHRGFISRTLGEGDISGNIFGVRINDGDEPANLTGCACVGYFIRADGITLVIDGSVSGNTASVQLPEACYAVTGSFSLAIKVTGTGFSETMRIVYGTVADLITGEINDPSEQIPSLEDLLEVISRAETAADTINGISITTEQITGTRYKIKVTKT